MNYTPEQLIATNLANVETLKTLTTQAYAGFEKLVELNLAASKALMGESFTHMQTILGAKDAQQLLALQAGLFQPMAEKTAAYGRHAYAIATESGAGLSKVLEAQVAEAQKTLAGVVESVAKNAPAGSEGAVAMLKNAVSAGQNAIESAQHSAKSALETVETSITAATAQAIQAVAAVTSKA